MQKEQDLELNQPGLESWLCDLEPPFTQLYNGKWGWITGFFWALLG